MFRYFVRMFAVITLCLLWNLGSARAEKTDPVLNPFWTTHTVQYETLLFVRERGQLHATARLMFPADCILSVRQAAWKHGKPVVYREGRDFRFTPGTQTLTLTRNSSIPFRERASFYNTAGSMPFKMRSSDPLNAFSPYSPPNSGPKLSVSSNANQLQQVEIAYTHSASWKGYTPDFQGNVLRHTLQRLQARRTVKILLTGDSIGAGFGATARAGEGERGFAPYRTSFGSLFVAALKRAYGDPDIRLTNVAAPGAQADDGAFQVKRSITPDTDLVLVEFGMNDASSGVNGKHIDRMAEFKAHLKTLIEVIRIHARHADIVLISPMLGNPEWTRTLYPFFLTTPQHPGLASAQEVIYQLASSYSGVAVADVTQLWRDILQAKGWTYSDLLRGKPLIGWYDLSANGLNHPNDWGHLLYAQVLAALFVPHPPVSHAKTSLK